MCQGLFFTKESKLLIIFHLILKLIDINKIIVNYVFYDL